MRGNVTARAIKIREGLAKLAPLERPGAIPHAEGYSYRYWRLRIMYSMMMGYAVYYFVRLNFSIAAPFIKQDLNLTQTDIGWIFSLFSVVYGVGKFLNGFLSDRFNARYFMAIGLFLSAIANLYMGNAMSFGFLAGFCALNGWFQSMGWPPCARLLTHWYSPMELGRRWGIWNASHQIGGAIILWMGGGLIYFFGWRAAFYVPAAIAIISSLFLFNRLRDTPRSLGLPTIEEYKNLKTNWSEESYEHLSFKEILSTHILSNRLVWYISFATFFLYVVRMGFLNWAPTFLVEVKGSTAGLAGGKLAVFELAGIAGGITAGWLSDSLFKGRRGALACLYMLALMGFLFYFWLVPAGHEFLDFCAMLAVGFLVYGPQVLSGVAAADFSSKKAAGAATGLTGTFGNLGGAFAGIGVGAIAQIWGWNGGFLFFVACALLGALCFGLTWHHRSKALG